MSELMLSVAIITYNQEKYIAQTLDSILQQKHNYSYEIIIGEDCSTDGTRAILEMYRKRFPEIVKPIYNEKNLGLIKNYFNVINNCSGKYIMECGGDDYWLPGKVEKQIVYMENNPEIDFYYGKGQILKNDKLQNRFWGKEVNNIDQLFFYNMDIPVQSACFKKKCILRYIMEENPIKKNWFSEDYPFAIWLLHNCKIKFADINFFVYRILDNSLSHSKNVEKYVRNLTLDYNMKLYFMKKYDYNNELMLKNEFYYCMARTYAKFFKYKNCKEYLDLYSANNKKRNLLKFLYKNRLSFYILAFMLNLL